MVGRSVVVFVFVSMAALLGFSTYCAWRSGEVKGYCVAKYGPDVEVVWTGGLGIAGECVAPPTIPGKREVVP